MRTIPVEGKMLDSPTGCVTLIPQITRFSPIFAFPRFSNRGFFLWVGNGGLYRFTGLATEFVKDAKESWIA